MRQAEPGCIGRAVALAAFLAITVHPLPARAADLALDADAGCIDRDDLVFQVERALGQPLEAVSSARFVVHVQSVRRRFRAELAIMDGPGAQPRGFRSLAANTCDELTRQIALAWAVGFNADIETEATDREFTLPPGQERLIREVAAKNRNVIVVVTAGGSVDVSPWLGDIEALVAQWYPGQEGGTALAQLLLGRANFSGRLPITWERRLADNPTSASCHPNDPSDPDAVVYREGVFMGYRGYQQRSIRPAFPRLPLRLRPVLHPLPLRRRQPARPRRAEPLTRRSPAPLRSLVRPDEQRRTQRRRGGADLRRPPAQRAPPPPPRAARLRARRAHAGRNPPRQRRPRRAPSPTSTP